MPPLQVPEEAGTFSQTRKRFLRTHKTTYLREAALAVARFSDL
jgi:hypothetical protein